MIYNILLMDYKRLLFASLMMIVVVSMSISAASAQSVSINNIDISDTSPNTTDVSYNISFSHSNINTSNIDFVAFDFASDYSLQTESTNLVHSATTLDPSYLDYTVTLQSTSNSTLYADVVVDNPSAGNYDIQLAYLGSAGSPVDTDTYTTSLDSPNSAPSASFDFSPSSPVEGESITFNGSGSSDPDGDSLTYSWDVDDDGTYEESGETINYNYTQEGDYNVTLKVSDGSLTDTITKTVSVSIPTYTTTITVHGVDGNVSRNTTVYVYQDDVEVENATTDSEGNVSFTLKGGEYTFEASSENASGSLFVELDSDSDYTLELVDDSAGGGGAGSGGDSVVYIVAGILGVILLLVLADNSQR